MAVPETGLKPIQYFDDPKDYFRQKYDDERDVEYAYAEWQAYKNSGLTPSEYYGYETEEFSGPTSITKSGTKKNKSSSSSGSGSSNSIYGSMQDAANAAIDAQIQSGVNSLTSQKDLINQSYDDLAKQAYAAYRQEQMYSPYKNSQLATGTADTMDLKSRLNYENNLASSERNRLNALNDVDTAIENLRLSGDASKAGNAEKYALLELQAQQEAAEKAAAEQAAYAAALASQATQTKSSGTPYTGNDTGPKSLTAAQLQSLYESGQLSYDEYAAQMLANFGIRIAAPAANPNQYSNLNKITNDTGFTGTAALIFDRIANDYYKNRRDALVADVNRAIDTGEIDASTGIALIRSY